VHEHPPAPQAPQAPQTPQTPQAPQAPPRRRRRFRPLKWIRNLFLLLLCVLVAYAAVRYGPNLYRRFIGNGNTAWVSERFSEELKAKNELIVYEATLTGQETVTQDAWLLGTVQKVTVPYTFTIGFTVDLSLASVSVDAATDTIVVQLPPPVAKYPKLTVDQTNLQKNDWLYPLTPERYAEITAEIELKLTEECSGKQAYLDAAWEAAVDDMESLFGGIAAQSTDGVTCAIRVIENDGLAPAETTPEADAPTPSPTPEAA
jgi:hypothetical protein